VLQNNLLKGFHHFLPSPYNQPQTDCLEWRFTSLILYSRQPLPKQSEHNFIQCQNHKMDQVHTSSLYLCNALMQSFISANSSQVLWKRFSLKLVWVLKNNGGTYRGQRFWSCQFWYRTWSRIMIISLHIYRGLSSYTYHLLASLHSF
jgi:hypothetical protein